MSVAQSVRAEWKWFDHIHSGRWFESNWTPNHKFINHLEINMKDNTEAELKVIVMCITFIMVILTAVVLDNMYPDTDPSEDYTYPKNEYKPLCSAEVIDGTISNLDCKIYENKS